MIPNLTMLVCAYVVFRCVEAAASTLRPRDGERLKLGPRRIAVLVAAALCAAVALYLTIDTVLLGAGLHLPGSKGGAL